MNVHKTVLLLTFPSMISVRSGTNWRYW